MDYIFDSVDKLFNEKKISELSDNELLALYDESSRAMEFYGDAEQATKNTSNGLYGYFGGVYGMFSDTTFANDITSEGVNSNKFVQAVTNNWWQKDFYDDTDLHNLLKSNFPDVVFDIENNYHKVRKENEYISQYSDTDSVYVNCGIILEAYGLGNIVKDTDTTLKIVNFIDSYRLEPLYEKTLKVYSQSRNFIDNLLIFEKEAVFIVGIFLAKKKYMLATAEKDGVNVIKKNILKTTGIELARTGLSQKAKYYIKRLSNVVLSFKETDSKIDFLRLLQSVKNDFLSLSKNEIIEILSERMKLKVYNNYVNVNSNGVYDIKKGAQSQTKGAANYNIFVEKNELTAKYPQLEQDMVCKYYYTNDSDTFAYNPEYGIPPNVPDLDYDKMFEKMVLNPMGRISKDILQGFDIKKANNTNITINTTVLKKRKF